VAHPANAGILTFDPNTIMPGKGGQANPAIVIGNGTLSYLLDKDQKPILPTGVATAANDGYTIQNFTYFVTAAANPGTGKVNPISIDWLTQENFASNVASNITVTITGNLSISLNAGSMGGQVGGLVDNNFAPTVLFNFPPPPANAVTINGPANNVQVPWNKSAVKMNVADGMHTLNMVTSLSWNPTAVGDKLTIVGSYTVTASAEAVPGMPEPSSFVLVGIGALSALFVGVFHSRLGVPR
jgi:hypothetical protein